MPQKHDMIDHGIASGPVTSARVTLESVRETSSREGHGEEIATSTR